ncbi:MAG TPA: MFS transporter [Rhodanobacter sp.]|nr:MFS transporter [Rhodanobacter sp.]
MTSPAPGQSIRILRLRAVVASTVGTTVEWYDFFLYGTAAALVFPDVFFPSHTHATGILLSFSTQAVGFAARPIGAIIFGHFGDRVGRKATLIATLMLMGIATALMSVVPSYSAIGVSAPLLLITLRILQGIGVGGEWGGSVLLSMEWGTQRRRGFWASWPQVGVSIGLLLSTGMIKLFGHIAGSGFNTWGWRVPFALSLVLVAIGLYVRLRVLESPAFSEVKRERAVVRLPVWQVIREQPLEVATSAFVRMSEQAPFYLFVTFVLSYGTDHLGLSKDSLLNDVLVAAALGLVSIPLFGHLSDRIGRRRMYGIGIVCIAAFAFPYYGLLNTKSSGLILLAVVLSLVFHDMQYGPQAALIAESFGPATRYSGAGLGYQLASLIAGGPAPLIAAAIVDATNSSTWVSVYIIGCAVLSMIALLLMPRREVRAAPSRFDEAVDRGMVAEPEVAGT